MSKVKLIFGTHNTVPYGEVDQLFENAYQKAFKPFLTAIYNHPEIRPTLFYAGPLLQWLDKRHPEFHTVLVELTTNKSIEILGGGYWEPIFPLIPASDRVGQIEMMTTYLRKCFGKRSRGSWITEQIWEAHLASSLSSSGMDYIFLSEKTLPRSVHFRPESPVIAEEQGKTIVIFPLKDSLANSFLKVPPEHILESLRTINQNREEEREEEFVVSLILDGLSLGGGGSHQICYGEKWLERFFSAVLASRDWLECIHPSRYIRNTHIARKKVYIPGPSYSTLMNWTKFHPGTTFGRKANEFDQRNIRSKDISHPETFYREFLSKYCESSFLYAKMMHVGVLTNQIKGDKSRKKAAKEELWKGQGHYAYWHGPTGGLYNTRLRHATYHALIEAEKATRERGIFKAALGALDFDMDGEKEFLYNGLSYNAYIHSIGAALFELDYLPVSRNYLATLTRYPEDYHPPATQEQGYDSYPRQAFLDHILYPTDNLQSFEHRGSQRKNPFLKSRYVPLEVVREQQRVSLSCRRVIDDNNSVLEIHKTYRFRRHILEVEYTLSNLSMRNFNFPWGTEINLALSDEVTQRQVYLNDGINDGKEAPDRAHDKDILAWTVRDKERDVVLEFQVSESAELWRFPVYADYRVGSELQRQYQSSCFLPHWQLNLAPLESSSFQIILRIGRSKNR